MTVEPSGTSHGITPVLLAKVPHQPGVYLMKDAADSVLYVGKARDLRNRLASYAGARLDRDAKTAMLLSRVASLETIVTATEKEALILEASLIKKHRPKYNVILRDDKNYPLLKVTTNEAFPRLLVVRRRIKDGSRYFGPYASASAMWATVKHLNSLFPLRRCPGKEVRKRSRPCLNHQMGRCQAPCLGKVSAEHYQDMVQAVLMILSGKGRELLGQLERQMATAAEAWNFEEAARCRDALGSIKKTLEKQVVVASHFSNQDVFGFVRQEMAVAVAIVGVHNGAVDERQAYFLADPVGDDKEVLAEVVRRYYGDLDRPIPEEILLPFALEDKELLSEWLTDLRGSRTVLTVPQRGHKKNLLTMALDNAKQMLREKAKGGEVWQVLGAAVRDALNLECLPNRIECLDISNISGTNAVGALVCFRDGDPDKSAYRHYRIRTVSGPDDYAMMAEVLGRRFAKTGDLPDLLLVDGGKGQLNIAKKIVQETLTSRQVYARIEMVAIAKERGGEGEKLFVLGRKDPLPLAQHSPVLLFFMRIRDEAHRYGITFHRRLRQREAFSSEIDLIPGVGLARKKALLTTLGSVQAIRSASVAELTAVPHIGAALAQQIWDYFHKTSAWSR